MSDIFIADQIDSTVELTDSSGNLSSSASYDSFGNSTNNLTTRYQYTGREFDNFTGLQYSRARWYDANLGRFISEDPIGFDGGDVNLYGYVKNGSIKYIDSLGTQRQDRDRPGDFFPGMSEPYNPKRPKPPASEDLKHLACAADGYNPWVQIELGAVGHFITTGGGAAEGAMINVLTGEICIYSKLHTQSGLGLFGGLSLQGGGMLGSSNGADNFDEHGDAGAVEIGENVSLAGGEGIEFPFKVPNNAGGSLGWGGKSNFSSSVGFKTFVGGGAEAHIAIDKYHKQFCFNSPSFQQPCQCSK